MASQPTDRTTAAGPTSTDRPVLELRDLRVHLAADGGTLPAVDGVSLRVWPGERVGLVGESGCGKTMTARSILRLFPAIELETFDGQVLFGDRDLMQLTPNQLRSVRGTEIGIIFQDPMTYLNPTMRVDKQVAEVLPRSVPAEERRRRVRTALSDAGLEPERVARRYPHELSGGMRQRILIAMALVGGASLIIADEPTTALDVTVQAAILGTLRNLADEGKASVLLITHDLAVVASFCDRVYVMYSGRIVEEGDVVSVFEEPQHPYTRGLLGSLPSRVRSADELVAIPGSVPDLRSLPTGCHFRPRCSEAWEQCEQAPPWVSGNGGGALCWLGVEDADGRHER